MNLRKIIFYFILILIIGGIAFLVYKYLPPRPNNRFTVILLETSHDAKTTEKYLNIIKEYTKELKGLQLNLITPKNSESIVIQKPFSPVKQTYISDKVKDFIIKKMGEMDSLKISPNIANSEVESILQSFITSKHDDNAIPLIFGSFPQCYSKEDAKKAIGTIDKLYKPEMNTRQIIWAVNSNIDEPEQEILKTLEGKFQLVNKQFTTEKRPPCNPDYTNVDIVVLSRIDSSNANDLIKKISNEIPASSKIRIVSMSGVNVIQQNQSIDLLLKDALTNTRSNTFLESRTLLIQTLNTWENPKDTNNTKIFLLGKVPQPTKGEIQRLRLLGGGLISTPAQLTKFANRKKIEFVLALLPYNNQFDFGRILYDKFNQMIIKVKKL